MVPKESSTYYFTSFDIKANNRRLLCSWGKTEDNPSLEAKEIMEFGLKADLVLNQIGLSLLLKRWKMRDLLSLQNPDILCLVETKLKNVRESDILKIWNEENLDWLYSEADGNSGRLLVI
ncbi:hypothetical protein ACFE04_021463 [Oxalis oulophora]